MNESERMTDLILDAYGKCQDNGHRMDWRRYDNYYADANCIKCKKVAFVDIWEDNTTSVTGFAINTQCKGKP